MKRHPNGAKHNSLQLLGERECRLAAVHNAIEHGIADIKEGRVHNANAVFDELEARYTAMARERGEM